MSGEVALFVALLFIGWVFWHEGRQRIEVSRALVLPIAWYLVTSSRPVGVWLYLWGIPIDSGSGVEGTSLDGWIYAAFIAGGLTVLARRNVSWIGVLRGNVALGALLMFMVLSIGWSAFPSATRAPPFA